MNKKMKRNKRTRQLKYSTNNKDNMRTTKRHEYNQKQTKKSYFFDYFLRWTKDIKK